MSEFCHADNLALQIPVPQHRMTPLKTHWMEIFKPITENLKLDMRMNLKTKKVGAHSHALRLLRQQDRQASRCMPVSTMKLDANNPCPRCTLSSGRN
eukprot:868904-Pelagomonas_calceolata.AAC.4